MGEWAEIRATGLLYDNLDSNGNAKHGIYPKNVPT